MTKIDPLGEKGQKATLSKGLCHFLLSTCQFSIRLLRLTYDLGVKTILEQLSVLSINLSVKVWGSSLGCQVTCIDSPPRWNSSFSFLYFYGQGALLWYVSYRFLMNKRVYFFQRKYIKYFNLPLHSWSILSHLCLSQKASTRSGLLNNRQEIRRIQYRSVQHCA